MKKQRGVGMGWLRATMPREDSRRACDHRVDGRRHSTGARGALDTRSTLESNVVGRAVPAGCHYRIAETHRDSGIRPPATQGQGTVFCGS